jgi:hypothetical protein
MQGLDEVVQMHQSIVDALRKEEVPSLIQSVEFHSWIALEHLMAISPMKEDETNNDYQGGTWCQFCCDPNRELDKR